MLGCLRPPVDRNATVTCPGRGADAGVTPNCDLDVSPDTNLIQNGSRCALDLVIDPRLEDLAGNRVGQLFDRSLREGASDRGDQTDATPVRLRIQD